MTPDDFRMRLRRNGSCASCGIAQARGQNAFWSPSARAVFCEPCVGGADLARSLAGSPGGAAAREHARRQTNDAARLKARWGKFTPIVEHFTPPRQSTHAWARGAAGEERLAAFLERELGDGVILLHDRRVPGSRANIDHIGVGPSGVWVIDAKRYTGTVRRRDVGGRSRTDVRVFVGEQDQTKLVKKVPGQVAVVAKVLTEIPAYRIVNVRGALCFTDSDWGFMNLGQPFTIDDVLVTYPGALRSTLREPAVLSSDAVGQLAARLATDLPVA